MIKRTTELEKLIDHMEAVYRRLAARAEDGDYAASRDSVDVLSAVCHLLTCRAADYGEPI